MPRFPAHPDRRPALIAGASSGIGAACAVALSACGYPVALGARRVENLEEFSVKCSANGGESFTGYLDVSADVRPFVEAATAALGPPEILVCSAGDLEAGLVHETDPDSFSAQVQVHLVGVHRLIAAVVPGLVERQRGDVVLISSDVARTPRPRMGGYVAAKAGVEGMAEAMRMELEGTGVRVGVVRPGPTLTSMGMNWDAETTQAVLDDWGRWGLARHPYFLRPSDVAAAVTAMVTTPRGAHLTLIEIQPEAKP
jgi:NADP-dependent 3-hydroxy acid dehydrogenase YdfG